MGEVRGVRVSHVHFSALLFGLLKGFSVQDWLSLNNTISQKRLRRKEISSSKENCTWDRLMYWVFVLLWTNS